MPTAAKRMTKASLEALTKRIGYLRDMLSQTTDVIRRRALMMEISRLESNWAFAIHPVR